jgi:flagellar motor switch protein FliG
MIFRQKVNLTRFQKSMDGITTFACLIEQADPAHRQKIIEQAKEQDSEFLNKVLRRVIYFEEMIYVDESVMAEILSKTSAKVLAHALYGQPKEFREKILSQVGHRELKAMKDEEEKLSGELSKSLVLGAQRQILKIGRLLESQGKFIFELNDCPRFTSASKKKATRSSK